MRSRRDARIYDGGAHSSGEAPAPFGAGLSHRTAIGPLGSRNYSSFNSIEEGPPAAPPGPRPAPPGVGQGRIEAGRGPGPRRGSGCDTPCFAPQSPATEQLSASGRSGPRGLRGRKTVEVAFVWTLTVSTPFPRFMTLGGEKADLPEVSKEVFCLQWTSIL